MFVPWLILSVLSWPVALLALILYPIVWVVLLPFRIVGISVQGVLEPLRAIVTLSARMLRSKRQHRQSPGSQRPTGRRGAENAGCS